LDELARTGIYLKRTHMTSSIRFGILSLAFWAMSAGAQNATVNRAAELRSEKLVTSAVLSPVTAGTAVRVLSVEGGWVLVEMASAQGKVAGWVRASALNMQANASSVAGLSSGREAAGNNALTLGVRGIPTTAPRINRHALIIGVGRYGDPSVPPLPGTRLDRYSATQMAQVMQVPEGNIQYLQDDQATGENIRAALKGLNDKVQDLSLIHI
jgi:hypothetical protein